jgi:hypothetical protein
MKIVGYELKPGARFQSGAVVDAELIGTALEEITKSVHGELTPPDVVAAARANNHQLHSHFEWDDAVGGEQYRLKQARDLIRCVVAVYRPGNGAPIRSSAFVHIPEAGAAHYRDMSTAMSHKKTRGLILRQAWRELQQWRAKYKDLRELATVFEAAAAIETHVMEQMKD